MIKYSRIGISGGWCSKNIKKGAQIVVTYDLQVY